MSETNAARAAEIARSIRVYRDRLRGIDEDKVAAAIAAALSAAEARGRQECLQIAIGAGSVRVASAIRALLAGQSVDDK